MLQVTVVFYEDDGVWCSQCLEIDVAGQGASREEAAESVLSQVRTWVAGINVEPDAWHVQQAPDEFWTYPDKLRFQFLFDQGRHERAMEKQGNDKLQIVADSLRVATEPPDGFRPAFLGGR